MAFIASMAFITFMLLITLAVAGVIALFVAFTQQGKQVPHSPWLSDRLQRVADRVDGYLEGRTRGSTSHD
jgi:hypothetical protein